ncbi:SDR family NAD(P)-dependent oxidoreductase [Tunicatimonas pelagia]|uniref:SDR family NAD(P)-dependent oxidoreductase n=1 Tax=Tunicatimonas pelagia TaxID=931531 RepID=UPI00266586BB|nr:SDR family oxidoreductase [Tunicatimonas pelagia]WKN42337.1 SDR family oxidoreductase [Tunicatimonas pelagia]
MNTLILGGASGLGESITTKLAEKASDTIYFTYCHSVESASSICQKFPNGHKIQCDFTDPSSLDAFLEVIDDLELDAIVNNAITGMQRNHFHKMETADISKSFQHNVLPILAITQRAIKQFKKKKFGKIVTILSAALINKPPVGWSEYTANKAYLASMSKSWATEYVKFNITSNSISPSLMLTDLNQDIDPRVIEQITNNHPLRELLNPSEVADTVAFLLQTTQQINGVNLVINAGTDVV